MTYQMVEHTASSWNAAVRYRCGPDRTYAMSFWDWDDEEELLRRAAGHRARDLTVANFEHSDLGAEHFNAGGFTHCL
jgi:hypothetical protein